MECTPYAGSPKRLCASKIYITAMLFVPINIGIELYTVAGHTNTHVCNSYVHGHESKSDADQERHKGSLESIKRGTEESLQSLILGHVWIP